MRRDPALNRRYVLLGISTLAIMAACGPKQEAGGKADPSRAPNPNAAAAIKAFLDTTIAGLASISRAEQEAELNWFASAAAPYQGFEIKVVSETLTTHEFESKVLAPAFEAITGIKVKHLSLIHISEPTRPY